MAAWVRPDPGAGGWRRLRDGVHATDHHGDLVLLDVTADGYFCLPQAGAILDKEGRIRLGHADVAAQLDAAGLLAPEELVETAAARRLTPPPLPTRTALTDSLSAPGWRDGADLVVASLDVARHYRGRSLEYLVQLAAKGPRPPASGSTEAELVASTRAFHRWAPFAPVSGKCLLRSFMLLRHLRRKGHDAAWVFAVRTWPFAAHCWLQVGDMALDDEPERLVAFQPILVV